MIPRLLLLILLLMGVGSVRAQFVLDTAQGDSTPEIRQVLFLPIAYYTPETRLAGGVSALALYRPSGVEPTTPLSSAQLIATYTQNRQVILFLPFQAILKNGDYRLVGQLGYLRYPYLFNGIGNNASDETEEEYTARFPRIRVHGLRRVRPNTFVGARYWFQDTRVIETQSGGLLETGNVPGADRSRVSGLGPIFLLDSRDNLFAPQKGTFFQLSAIFNNSVFGSNYHYENYVAEVRKYWSVYKQHVLAVHGFSRFLYGSIPFNQLAQLGGPDQMRGYRQGLYRDKKMALAQAEYRTPFVYRVGLAAFASYGGVGDELNDLQGRLSYGGGLRFQIAPEQRLHFRFDVGIAEGAPAYYVRLNEAF